MASPIHSLGETLGGGKGPSHGLDFKLLCSDHLDVTALEDPTLLLSDSCSINLEDSELLEIEHGMNPSEPTGDEIDILSYSMIVGQVPHRRTRIPIHCPSPKTFP
jgi:hypothetical protein